MGSGKLSVRLEDIAKLEINSMLVDGIWGRKMPHPAAAFCEIVSAWVYQFDAVLRQLGNPLPEKISENAGRHSENIDPAEERQKTREIAFLQAKKSWNEKKPEIFDRFVKKKREVSDFACDPTIKPILNALLDEKAMNGLRSKLRKFIYKKDSAYFESELFRLLRLQTRIYCLLDAYAEAGPENKPEFRDVQELRKLWELKDGYIYAQNTIQVDGDAINRINARLQRDKLAGQFHSELLDFHCRNVEAGLGNWQFLVKTLVDIAKAAVSGVVNWVSSKIYGPIKID